MKLTEIYHSIQGEGPNVGQPTTFVRFGGCNLRCPGWGQGELPDGTEVGCCDTIFSVYPEFRDTWKSMNVEEIVEEVIGGRTSRVCLTGGEPLIQRTSDLLDLIDRLVLLGYETDIFTNGTQDIRPYTQYHSVTFILDYKLPGSGEYDPTNRTLWRNLLHLRQQDAVKFVIANRDDFLTAILRMRDLEDVYFQGTIYFGVVWDQLEEAELVSWMAEVNKDLSRVRLNIQTHKYIWDPEKRKV